MNSLYTALLSPFPPDPSEPRGDGFKKWDLDQTYHRLLSDLYNSGLEPGDEGRCNFLDRINNVKKNYTYLRSRL